MPVSVRKVSVPSEPDSSYFLRVAWKGRDLGSGFKLVLTDGQDAWRGEVSEEAVSEEAQELEMQLDSYIQDLHQALVETETSPSIFSFTLTPSPPAGSSSITLAYGKVQKDISFQLGSVALKAVPEPAAAVREILVRSLQRGNILLEHNEKLEEENQRLRQEQERIAAEMKRYTAGKEALETELYSRFVLVLNEKKAKIRSLQETVTKLQEKSSEGKKKKASVKLDRTETEEREEYGGSTDEEPEEEEEQTPASTSSPQDRSADSPLDDGLKDLIDVAPTRKRRIRHLGAPDPVVKKPTPRTSELKRPDPPAGSSKQQTPQRSTDAAAATLEAEDLFDDF